MDTYGIPEKIAQILGIKRRTVVFDNIIRRGFSFKEVSRLKKALCLSDLDLAQHIGISIKTLRRRRASSSRFTLLESDRIYRIARMFALASIVFNESEDAREWMMERQYILDNEIPFILIQTTSGANEVEDALGRIAYGVLV